MAQLADHFTCRGVHVDDVLVTGASSIATDFTEVDTVVEAVLGLLIVRTEFGTIVLWTH